MTAAAIRPQTRPSRPSAWQLLLRNRLAAAGLLVLAVVVALAVLAPLLPLADPMGQITHVTQYAGVCPPRCHIGENEKCRFGYGINCA